MKNYRFISISGTGRSGTNITKDILSKHPDVGTLPFEHRFTIDPKGLVDTFNTLRFTWSPYVVDYKINELENFLKLIGKRKFWRFQLGQLIKWLNRHGLNITPPAYYAWELSKWFPDYFEMVEKLIQQLIDFKYRATWPGAASFNKNNQMSFVSYEKNLANIFGRFIQNLYQSFLKAHNKTHFVEDNTWSILFAPELFTMLPEIKFIHVLRDPRDVVVSFLNQKWTPNDLDQCIDYYISIISKIIENKKKIPAENILEISLEQLVEKPERTMRQVCKFCGLDYTDDLLKIDLSRSNKGRWKLELNVNEQQRLNHKLKNYIDLFGY
ncbi:sulfotransferase family protein [Caldithrix abyssi]